VRGGLGGEVKEENPYEEHSEEILEYCEECCRDCPPSEMCPGCDCDLYCEDVDWDDSDDCMRSCLLEHYECCELCGEPCEDWE
jgi:hypothetical protein